MFVHAGASSAAAGRFGEEVFQNPTPASGTIPIDFPASPDYVVGPGDGLTIDLWGGVSQRLVRTVDHEGRVALPMMGLPSDPLTLPVIEAAKAVDASDAVKARETSLPMNLMAPPNPGFPLISGPTGNIQLTTSECNGRDHLRCSVGRGW
jgi:hypothetical protein